MNQAMTENAIAAVVPTVVTSGLLVSLFTAQAPDGLFSPTGAPSGTYADVAGLTSIPCMAAPPSPSTIQATETRALEDITAAEIHEVWLAGYYPALDDGWRDGWICQIEWKGSWYPYNIMGMGADSQSQATVVKVKLATL